MQRRHEGLDVREDPFKTELREWVFGSEDFLRRKVAVAEGSSSHRQRSTSRRLRSVSVQEILSATANAHGVDRSQYALFRSQAAGRDMGHGCAASGLERLFRNWAPILD